MNKNRIKKLSILANTKFLSLYDAEYENKNGKIGHWAISSRKDINTLNAQCFEGKEERTDAAIIAAFHEEENKIVCIKQFRVPLNDYIYELPAGLIDGEEKFQESAARELREETGLKLISINHEKTRARIYASPGMTDESAAMVFCTCTGTVSDEYLEEEEDIEVMLLSQEEVKELLKKDVKIDIKAYMVFQTFVEIGEKLFK